MYATTKYMQKDHFPAQQNNPPLNQQAKNDEHESFTKPTYNPIRITDLECKIPKYV